jgi:hypothetical protein
MLWINVVGGVSVLGSYVHGLQTHPGSGDALWGGVPEDLRSLYTAGMLLAALGYFALTHFVFLRLDPRLARVGKSQGLRLFNGLYVAILLPSALWMPLTYQFLENESDLLWIVICLALGLVGLGAAGMTAALAKVEPKEPRWAQRLAVVGSAIFFLHTGVLDALVWTANFR